MRCSFGKTCHTARAQEVASLHPNAAIGIDPTLKNTGKLIQMPVNRLITARMQNHNPIATVSTCISDPIGGSKDMGTDRLIGEVEIVSIMTIILNITPPKEIDDKAITTLAGIDRRKDMIEVREMDNSDIYRPGALEKPGDSHRLGMLLLGQFIIEIVLERLPKALDNRAPAHLRASFGKKTLHRDTLRRLRKNKRGSCPIGKMNNWREIIRAEPCT